MPTAIFAFLIVYFAFHALTGERGMLTDAARDQVLAERRETLKELVSERRELESRVTLLKTNNLSRDLLEERARLLLGYADPRDYVIRADDLKSARS